MHSGSGLSLGVVMALLGGTISFSGAVATFLFYHGRQVQKLADVDARLARIEERLGVGGAMPKVEAQRCARSAM